MFQQARRQHRSGNGRAGVVPRFMIDYRAFGTLHRLVVSRAMRQEMGSRFAARLAMHFPEVAVRIDDGDFGILHLEVGALRLASLEAMLQGDWYAVLRHFNFVADLYETCGEELRRALQVSYLGNLFYGEVAKAYAQARVLLPPTLVIALEKVERHYEDMPQ